MSKISRAFKTKRLNEKRNPQKRMERITELRRTIKLYKSIIENRTKEVERLERQARWARYDLDNTIKEIAQKERELAEYESYEKGERK